MVERSAGVREDERLETEQLGELCRDLDGLLALAGHRGPRAVELLGPAVERERLQRMQREAPLVRPEGREWRSAARVRDPGTGLDVGRNGRDRPVGNAQEHEVGAVLAQCDTALEQSRAHRAPDASPRPDDDRVVDHSVLQFLSDTGHVEGYSTSGTPRGRPPQLLSLIAMA